MCTKGVKEMKKILLQGLVLLFASFFMMIGGLTVANAGPAKPVPSKVIKVTTYPKKEVKPAEWQLDIAKKDGIQTIVLAKMVGDAGMCTVRHIKEKLYHVHLSWEQGANKDRMEVTTTITQPWRYLSYDDKLNLFAHTWYKACGETDKKLTSKLPLPSVFAKDDKVAKTP